MEGEGEEIKSKQASKRDWTLNAKFNRSAKTVWPHLSTRKLCSFLQTAKISARLFTQVIYRR